MLRDRCGWKSERAFTGMTGPASPVTKEEDIEVCWKTSRELSKLGTVYDGGYLSAKAHVVCRERNVLHEYFCHLYGVPGSDFER